MDEEKQAQDTAEVVAPKGRNRSVSIPLHAVNKAIRGAEQQVDMINQHLREAEGRRDRCAHEIGQAQFAVQQLLKEREISSAALRTLLAARDKHEPEPQA